MDGILKKCFADKGYGFIRTEHHGDIFVHRKYFAPEISNIYEGMALTFALYACDKTTFIVTFWLSVAANIALINELNQWMQHF